LAPVEAAEETTCAPARRLVRTMQEAGLDAVAKDGIQAPEASFRDVHVPQSTPGPGNLSS
jgi:hypothetical protein